MSQENVDALRRGFEAINGEDLEALLDFIDPDFAAEIPPELSAEPDTYRGHEGLRRYFRSFQDAMDEIRFEPGRVWDVDDVVVVAVRVTAKGKGTGIPVHQEAAQVWTIRDGKALRVRSYASVSQALDAVGLPQEPSKPG
ncbi:MAG: nuclear transport factor 2 family protein [Actinobacteria bacterium]|nr:MAG: nuclear transport factor 2 family protein [Actinomycetota bacterium]